MGWGVEGSRFSATHLSVTVVTSLPVSISPLTFLPFITVVSTVGHRPIMPTGFMSPIAWLLTTGTSSFPSGLESVVQRCAAERRPDSHPSPFPRHPPHHRSAAAIKTPVSLTLGPTPPPRATPHSHPCERRCDTEVSLPGGMESSRSSPTTIR